MTSTTHPSAAIDPSRRTFLVGTASVAGVGVLAACSSGPGGSSSEPTGSSGSGAGGALVAVADVPVGGAISAKTSAGDDIVVAQPEEGTIVAFSAICTHQGCIVEADGARLVCPCHGSVFEAGTGANLSGPAPTPLPEFAVTVKDGQVVEA